MQQFIGSEVADALSDKLGTEVRVGRVDLGFFNRIIIDDVVMLDRQRQEMLRASRLSAKVEVLPLFDGRISISAAQLFGAHIRLYRDSLSAPTNFQYVLDAFASADTTSRTPLDLRINSLIMRHSSVQYDQHDEPQTPGRLNMAHLKLTDISAHIILKALKEDSLNLNIKKLSFHEQSSLHVDKLTMHVEASTSRATVSGFMLQLPKSRLTLGDVLIRYRWHDGKPMPGTIAWQGQIEESHINLSDLRPLVPDITSVTSELTLTSSFSGTDNSIDIQHLTASSADNDISINLNGFVHHWDQNPAWQFELNQLKLSAQSIAFATRQLSGKVAVPDVVGRLGNVNITGQAEGIGKSLDAHAQLHADIGQLDMTLHLTEQQHFSGHARSEGIQLGQLLADEQFGQTAMDIDYSGQLTDGKAPDIAANGSITRFVYQNYEYSNIDLNAHYSPTGIDGNISISDPNVQLAAQGMVERNGAAAHIQLHADIKELHPDALHLTQQWKNAAFSGKVEADLTAANIHDAQGTVTLSDFDFRSPDRQYHLDKMHIVSGYDNAHQHFFKLNSDFADVLIKGTFDYATLPQSMANLVGSYLPTLPGLQGNPAPRTSHLAPRDNNFAFQLNLNRTDWLQTLFNVPLDTRQPLLLSGFVNDGQQHLRITGSCPHLSYDGTNYHDAALHVSTLSDTLHCAAAVTRHSAGSVPLALNLHAKAADNQLMASLQWDNHAEQRMSGTLNTVSRFTLTPGGTPAGTITLLPSQLVVRNSEWQIAPAEITYASDNVTVSNFAVKHGQQHVIINGRASHNPADTLSLDIVDVDVEYILDLVNFHSVDFSGRATGRAYASSLFDHPAAETHLTVSDFKFEHGRMGTLDVDARWDHQKKIIDLNAIANDGPAAMTLISGYVDPNATGYIDLDIKAIGTHIDFAQSFTDSFANRVEGQAQGAVRLFGPLNRVNMTGSIVIDGEIDVRQLNTTYTLRQDTIHFIPDDIVISHCRLYDRDGHHATVDGHLRHQHLTRMTFDLDIAADHLLAYDFKDFGTDTFYGTVYGTGSVTIQGRPGRVEFDIDVTPEANTTFVYNVSSPDAITNREFIVWEATAPLIPEATATAAGMRGAVADIILNLTIRCTPAATIRLLMDAKTADYITLNGDGTLRATYYNKGGLQMFGTYVVDNGTYNMTIQELIKKNFTFRQGGTIVFGGAPFDAQLNLQAQHTVNGVSLSDLDVSRSFSTNTVRVNCLMNISGAAHAPQVDFDLAMPTVSADEQQMIRSVINGQQEMNQQVLYLLGIGRFYPQTGNNATTDGQTVQSQTSLAMQSLLSGTISSQINSILKNVVNSSNWNFGANISTGNEGWNNAEYEGLVSGRLLNNRLLINGQFGYRDRATSTTATPSFIGDFDVQYLLTPTGSISIKVYNQTNDRYFTRSSLNTQGLGFILKKDFTNFTDLFGIKRKKQEQNKEQ